MITTDLQAIKRSVQLEKTASLESGNNDIIPHWSSSASLSLLSLHLQHLQVFPNLEVATLFKCSTWVLPKSYFSLLPWLLWGSVGGVMIYQQQQQKYLLTGINQLKEQRKWGKFHCIQDGEIHKKDGAEKVRMGRKQILEQGRIVG